MEILKAGAFSKYGFPARWVDVNDRVGVTYTTICLRPRRGFRMNLRVRRVTSAMVAALSVQMCMKLLSAMDLTGVRPVDCVMIQLNNIVVVNFR